MTRLAAAFLSLISALLLAMPAMAEKRVALVIGNSAYEHTAPLPNPKNDAKDLTAVLKRLGFEVLGGTDLTHRKFVRSVVKFSRKLRTADVGLFFYAGHGLQVSGQNYLVPIDAELKDEADLQFAMVKLNDVLAQMERSTKTNLIFIDACRDNPLARSLARAMGRTRSGSIGRGLASVRTGIGSMITFATEPGNVALDGKGKNSPFTKALLKHIETPGLDISLMLRKVRLDVIKATRRSQVPWDHSSLTDSFYFKTGQLAAKVRSEPVRSSDAAREWASLRSSKDAGDLEAYIAQFAKRFPYYGRKAKKRLRSLKEKKVAVGVFPKQQQRKRLSYEPEVVHIPGGTFFMGCVSSSFCDFLDAPEHRVTVSSFFMSKYETTVREYLSCVQAETCRSPEWREKDSKFNIKSGSDNHYKKLGIALTSARYPIVGVSWKDAIVYAKWLSKKTGQTWRLPTEAEWEYAARGDKTGNNNTPYSFGYTTGKNRANCNSDCRDNWEYTSPVGSFPGNSFGLYDMHGNVWEWVHDWYGEKYYFDSVSNNPKGPRSGHSRVFRGGGWSDIKKNLRSAVRIGNSPYFSYKDLGFRLVRQPSKIKSQTAKPPKICITIGRKIQSRIKLSVGTRFCDAGKRNEARVIKIANRAVVFLDNGDRKTCTQGTLCAFDWPVKPLFRIKARADAAKGIAPQATIEPR